MQKDWNLTWETKFRILQKFNLNAQQSGKHLQNTLPFNSYFSKYIYNINLRLECILTYLIFFLQVDIL